MPGNRRRSSIAAENSPPWLNAARIAAASASVTTNIMGAWERRSGSASCFRAGEQLTTRWSPNFRYYMKPVAPPDTVPDSVIQHPWDSRHRLLSGRGTSAEATRHAPRAASGCLQEQPPRRILVRARQAATCDYARGRESGYADLRCAPMSARVGPARRRAMRWSIGSRSPQTCSSHRQKRVQQPRP